MAGLYQGNLRFPSSHLKFLVQQLQSIFHIRQVEADNNNKQGWFKTSFKVGWSFLIFLHL